MISGIENKVVAITGASSGIGQSDGGIIGSKGREGRPAAVF